MNHLSHRLAAMADVACGPQPVDISSWANALTNASRLLKMLDDLNVEMEKSSKPPVRYYELASGGNMLCAAPSLINGGSAICSRPYRDHPTETYGDLVLHRLCDGRRVKL